MIKSKKTQLSDNEIRKTILNYFYKKNKYAKSRYGKKNSAGVSISIIRSELKTSNGLSQEEVVGNLNYLLSQGWIEEKPISKSFPLKSGMVVPSITIYYIITAAGIDKIDGESEFTRSSFSGIKIEATGQNIITLGDGNEINAKFENVGNALNDLKEEIKESTKFNESEKLDLVSDIVTIESQLTKSEPNKGIISTVWSGIKKIPTIAKNVPTLIDAYTKAEGFIAELLK